MNITDMAAAVKNMPEYTQTMNKLNQHVYTATQCMSAFNSKGLLQLSLVEQTIATGFDEDGKEVKGAKLFNLVSETLKGLNSNELKFRLLSIYFVSQKLIPTTPGAPNEDFVKQAIQIARLGPTEQNSIQNFEALIPQQVTVAQSTDGKKTSMFSSIFKGQAVKHEATPEGEYSDSRYLGQFKIILEQFLANDLPADKFPGTGPAVSASSKIEAKSVRKFGANARFALLVPKFKN
jgi:hypothetical protein